MKYICSATMKERPKPLRDALRFIISYSIFAGYILVARMYANRPAKVMEATALFALKSTVGATTVAINHQTKRTANLKPIAAMAAPTAHFALKTPST